MTIIVASFTTASTNYTAVCQEYKKWIEDFYISGEEHEKSTALQRKR